MHQLNTIQWTLIPVVNWWTLFQWCTNGMFVVVSEAVAQKLERKQQKLNDHLEQLQRLKTSLNELRSERLQIETDLQRRTRLEETKDELTKSNETLDGEILVSSFFFRSLAVVVFIVICCGCCWMLLFHICESCYWMLKILLLYCIVFIFLVCDVLCIQVASEQIRPLQVHSCLQSPVYILSLFYLLVVSTVLIGTVSHAAAVWIA